MLKLVRAILSCLCASVSFFFQLFLLKIIMVHNFDVDIFHIKVHNM